jgi:hypothetical protein
VVEKYYMVAAVRVNIYPYNQIIKKYLVNQQAIVLHDLTTVKTYKISEYLKIIIIGDTVLYKKMQNAYKYMIYIYINFMSLNHIYRQYMLWKKL